jgi:hypothetical protein
MSAVLSLAPRITITGGRGNGGANRHHTPLGQVMQNNANRGKFATRGLDIYGSVIDLAILSANKLKSYPVES